MAAAWLIVLMIYGFIAGFDHIPVIAWLLLIPFEVQDYYDRKS